MIRQFRHPASLGMLLAFLAACGGDGGTAPRVPTTVTLSPNTVTLTAVGQTSQLSTTILDQEGDPVEGSQVEWASSNDAVARVSPTGLVTATGLGSCQVTATVGDIAAVAQILVVEPAAMEISAGNGQSAFAGTPVPVRPAVRVLDAGSQPAAGVPVQFAVESGGGTVTGALVETDANGIATVSNWALGSGGVNTLTATVPGLGLTGDPALFVATVRPAAGFDIQIRHQGSPSSAQLLAFARAEVRWEALISGDLPNVQVNAVAGSCGNGSPALAEQVDDLLILANLSPIDGPGAGLGAAGPCFIRDPGDLPIVSQMRFDTDDLELMEADDLLEVVIRHEMGHALGIGTLWSLQGLLVNPSLSGGTDPHFTGANAIAAFDAAGGAGYAGQKVPVEDTGDEGTADSHWRESVFDTELMTGFVGLGASPLSAITLQSLRDQGYTVNLAGADPFSLGGSLRVAGASSGTGVHLKDDIVRGPIYALDSTGTVVGMVSR